MLDDSQPYCPCCKAPRAGVNNSQFHGLAQPADPKTGRPYTDPSETPAETGLIILSVLVPLAGIIIGCICLSNNEKRAGKVYLLAAAVRYIIGFLIVITFFLGAISFFRFFS